MLYKSCDIPRLFSKGKYHRAGAEVERKQFDCRKWRGNQDCRARDSRTSREPPRPKCILSCFEEEGSLRRIFKTSVIMDNSENREEGETGLYYLEGQSGTGYTRARSQTHDMTKSKIIRLGNGEKIKGGVSWGAKGLESCAGPEAYDESPKSKGFKYLKSIPRPHTNETCHQK